MNLDAYWRKYDETLARIAKEKPQTLDALKAILDDFEPPSSGVAFFPSGSADEGLDDALWDAGWEVVYLESDYLWQARSRTGERIHFVEGDVYAGPYAQPGSEE